MVLFMGFFVYHIHTTMFMLSVPRLSHFARITSARELIIMSLLLGFEYFCTLMSGSFLFGRCSVAFLCSLICWRMFSCEPRDESLRQDILLLTSRDSSRKSYVSETWHYDNEQDINSNINSNINSIHISYAQYEYGQQIPESLLDVQRFMKQSLEATPM